MFDVLSRGFKNATLMLQGKAELTEEVLQPALREVRSSLLQADVSLEVVRDFLDRVKQKALGEVVRLKDPSGRMVQVTPQDHFIKSCYDEMVDLMVVRRPGAAARGQARGHDDGRPAGLGQDHDRGQAGRKLQKEGKKPLLVAADIYRPAAIDQLMTLGRKLGVPVFSIKGMKPVELVHRGHQAKNGRRDVVIFDTAGPPRHRQRADGRARADQGAVARNILFVCDAMIGQDAVRTAGRVRPQARLHRLRAHQARRRRPRRRGAVDQAVTGKPVKFLGMGEALDKLEDFRPEGLAGRILGFGDVVGLVKDFEQHVDQATAEKTPRRCCAASSRFERLPQADRDVQKMGTAARDHGEACPAWAADEPDPRRGAG
jgi:signal recognition particle subunit SRP54